MVDDVFATPPVNIGNSSAQQWRIHANTFKYQRQMGTGAFVVASRYWINELRINPEPHSPCEPAARKLIQSEFNHRKQSRHNCTAPYTISKILSSSNLGYS